MGIQLRLMTSTGRRKFGRSSMTMWLRMVLNMRRSKGFFFNLLDEEWEGYVVVDVKEFPYLLIIMKLRLGYW